LQWIADCNELYQIKVRLEDDDEGGGASDGEPDERQLMLSQMSQNEHCMEIFYRLVAHSGTREATLRLLLDANAYVGWGPGGVSTGREERVGKLQDMMDALPIDIVLQSGVDLNAQRDIIKCMWAGDANILRQSIVSILPQSVSISAEGGVLRKCWDGGKRDLTTQTACNDWEVEAMQSNPSEMAQLYEQIVDELDGNLDPAQEMAKLYMQMRCDVDDLEDKLDAAQECLLNFFHQSGWFLRTIAVLFYSTREQLSGSSSSNAIGDGRHIAFSLDHAKVFNYDWFRAWCVCVSGCGRRCFAMEIRRLCVHCDGDPKVMRALAASAAVAGCGGRCECGIMRGCVFERRWF
jgi:hypothetical protein